MAPRRPLATGASRSFAHTSIEETEGLAARQAAEAAAEQAQAEARARLDRQARVATLLRDLKVNNASTILPELFALTNKADRLALALKCEENLTKKVIRNAQREDNWVRPSLRS